jgi:orotidine-5'-phosphate decarboxylase
MTAAEGSFLYRYEEIFRARGNRLCIGLDPDVDAMPPRFRSLDDPITAFNTELIDATADVCIAYKPNLAFYEAHGRPGITALENSIERIPEGVLTVGDAKRGDMGNTATRYARALFDVFKFDAITINPYLGIDSLEPFFGYSGRCVFVLALTSNPGSKDFQCMSFDGRPLYIHVIDKCLERFGDAGELGFVVGATHPDELASIRSHVGPSVPLLIPGLGTQGGDAAASLKANASGAALFNVSRGIAGAGTEDDFAASVRTVAADYAEKLREPMEING